MKVVIIGGSGYIGSRLILELREKHGDVSITVISRFKRTSLADFSRRFPDCNVVKKDIFEVSVSDLQGHDVVVHLAAIASVDGCNQKPDEALKTNILGAYHVYTTAVSSAIKHFIFMSTMAVHEFDDGNLPDLDKPTPLTMYSKTKILAENYLRQFKDDKTAITIIRSAALFGHSPNFRTDLLVNAAVHTASNKEPLTCHGDGNQIRPFLHIKDACAHIINLTFEVNPQPYKIETIYKEEQSVKQVLTIVSKSLEVEMVSVPRDYSGVSYKAFPSRDSALINNFSTSLTDGISSLHTRLKGLK